MDGNTRWCTATASAAFQESFGCDGQPGSYTDIDSCDALFLFGHNVAETQTVLWARMLDRLDGADPPRLVCVDPRRTNVAERATVHLPIRNGTNMALMNALVHEQIARGYLDEDYVDAHTIGFDEIEALTRDATRSGPLKPAVCRPRTSRRRRKSSAPANGSCRPARWASSTGTAAPVRSTICTCWHAGPTGCGHPAGERSTLLENNREAGCGPALPGFRNWENPEHVRELMTTERRPDRHPAQVRRPMG